METETAVFECELSKPRLKVNWLKKSDKNFKPEGRFEAVTLGQRYMLTIKNCELTDTDTMALKVEGKKYTAKLTVTGECKQYMFNIF